jgi:Zinc finger, C3HC4 type (RING finger)
MDMKTYQDERDSTQTCVKLECGHAFHTRCIISCLSQADRKCPQCNSNKDPEQMLTEEGVAVKLINEIKKDDRMKLLMGEISEAKEECATSVVQLKKDIRKYAEERSKELQVDTKRKYLINCLGELRRTAREVANEKGTRYVGALKFIYEQRVRYYGGTVFERYMFGRQSAYSLCRLKRPGLYMNLY